MPTKHNYKKRIIDELRDLPDEDMPKLLDIIHYLKEGILSDRKKKETKESSESLLNLEDIAVETGISDLAEHHDHYLYGVPKKDE